VFSSSRCLQRVFDDAGVTLGLSLFVTSVSTFGRAYPAGTFRVIPRPKNEKPGEHHSRVLHAMRGNPPGSFGSVARLFNSSSPQTACLRVFLREDFGRSRPPHATATTPTHSTPDPPPHASPHGHCAESRTGRYLVRLRRLPLDTSGIAAVPANAATAHLPFALQNSPTANRDAKQSVQGGLQFYYIRPTKSGARESGFRVSLSNLVPAVGSRLRGCAASAPRSRRN
jgi:hypothetical protein